MESFRKRINHMSPAQRLSAFGVLSGALFLGANTVDRIDGPEQSPVVEVVSSVGVLGMVYASIKGGGRVVTRLDDESNWRRKQEANARVAAASKGLPKNRKFAPKDFLFLSDRMAALEKRVDGKLPPEQAVWRHIGTTILSTRSGMPFSDTVGLFSIDIANLVEQVADARSGDSVRSAQIIVSDKDASIYPDGRTRIEEELGYVSAFLDNVMPLASGGDVSAENPSRWQDYLNDRVGQCLLARLGQQPE